MNAMVILQHGATRSESNAIARGLRRCDPDLLDSLIEQYQHRLLRYLTYFSGDRELARDLCQETWMRVLERGHQYNGRHEFSTWLYTVARNLTIDHLRRKRSISLDAMLEEGSNTDLEPRDSQAPAWEILQVREQMQSVHTALLKIPTVYRETVLLRFMDELALSEIADVVGVPLGTVKSRLARGLGLLMEHFKEGRS